MAEALKPSIYLKDKQNVNPSIDPLTEARAEDFREIANILEDHAIRIDTLARSNDQAEFYGIFTTVELVAAQFPDAPEDSFAVINPGDGNPQRIATVTNGVWTEEVLKAPIQFYTTKSARPPEGQTGIWYIVLDEKIAYLWHNGGYIGFGKDGNNGMDAYEVAVALGFVGSRQEWIDSIKESLEFTWNGTSLGVKKTADGDFVFANLKGDKGDKGDPGAGFENIPAEANKIPVTDGEGGIVWEDKPDTNIGGTDHVHDSYDTIAAMIADQENQIDGEYFVAIDATGDNTVDAGWALYEYLGTTLGTLDDYRKLSEEESQDIIQYDYAQDIADVQAEVDALELRVTALENKDDTVRILSSRLLTASDTGKKLCIEAPGIVLTYPAAGLGEGFEFNAVTNASGTLQLADENSGNDIDGATFLPEGSIGHAFKWPLGLLTTNGDWE